MLKIRHTLYKTSLPLIIITAFCAHASLLAQSSNYINPSGMTVETRFKLPEGYVRIPAAGNSYAYFLRNLSMFPDGAAFEIEPPEGPYAGILNMRVLDTIRQDIHLGVRLRAEYLFQRKLYDRIAFTIITEKIPYVPFVKGLQLTIQGKSHFTKPPADIHRYSTFSRYLSFIFRHSDVTTILSDMRLVSIDNIMPGDMFVQTARPGYAVVVLDVARNPATGDRIFLLAKNYKQEQNVFVLMQRGNSPWYSIKPEDDKIISPEFIFYRVNLRRFMD